MTNTKKKNSNKRKLLGAVGMLSVSAAMLVSSTFAWFTMNREVNATNMTVKAKAEGGLLISETDGHTTADQWDDTATAKNLPTGVVLLPTSSANTLAWYHANSKTANDEAGAAAKSVDSNNSGYNTLSLINTGATAAAVAGTSAANAIYYVDGDSTSGYTAAGDSAYYVKYTYYLKTSNESGVTNMGVDANKQCLSIKDVAVTGNTDSAVLDKSLRVGVAIGGKFYIFAPLYSGAGADVPADYYVYNGSSATGNNIQITPIPANGVAYTDVDSLNGVTTDAPLQADVYLWYEGEDVNCKSENITSNLDQLVVNLKFELANNGSTAKSLPENNAKSTSA